MNPLTLAYIDAISQGISHRQKAQALSRLNRLGLRLHFSHFPPGWIAGIQPVDQTEIWRQAGLPVAGVRYSTIGALVEGTRTSARFWPTSPYYQAWLGGYLLHGPPSYGLTAAGDLDHAALMQVALADQSAWLQNYGCAEPHMALRLDSFQVIEATLHQEHPAWLVKSVIDSCSDIGAANRSSEAYVRYRAYELMFARFAHLHLPPLCTLPPIWPLASYHELELDCLGLIVQVGSHDRWALLYCCAARWAGRENLSTLREPALEALHQVRIVSS